MARSKIDGVIESVRYAPDGRIAMARLYKRRGPIWSDQMIMDRKQLVEHLRRGCFFVTGYRKQYLGGMFEIGKPVRLHGGNIVTGERQSGHDHLPGVPVF